MRNKEILNGLKQVSPMLMGVFPMGLSVGIFSVENGFSIFESVLMSVFIFAGASQVATVDLLSNNAPFWVILTTATLINIRFLIYGAAVSPYLKKAKTSLKILLSYALTDMAFISVLSPKNSSEDKTYYYFGAALSVWVVWQVSFFLGAFFGAIVPENWPLGFALPLAFIFFTVSRLISIPTIIAALVSGAAAVVLIPIIPLHAGLVISIILGAVAGYYAKKLFGKKVVVK